MRDEENFEETLRGIILDICDVLYQHGYRTAPVGAIMRLIGVPEDHASAHDEEFFELDQDFVEELGQRRDLQRLDIPPGTVIH